MNTILYYSFIFFLLTAGCPSTASQEQLSSPDHAASFPHTVRIQCLFREGFLYADDGSDICRYRADLKPDDPAGHWVLEAVPEVNALWIRNVKTGKALHIEDQTGWVQLGKLQETFHSYRWRILDKGDYVHLESAWQEGRGISLENQNSDKAGMAGLNDEWWSLRFRLIPVGP
jgi:hypothetical protein